jgi:hypothetical protein
MGIRLVMEAATRAAADLTWRERYALMVLAASAIDDTRELPPGIEDKPDIVDRLRLSRTQRYAVIAALVEKSALLRLERGRNGVKAIYAIAPFVAIPGFERPGEPDAHPVDNPPKGPSFRDASAPAKGPGSENEGSRKPGLKHPSKRDPAPYKGSYGFTTGGGTPPPPGPRPLFPFALPDVPPEEGDSPRAKNPAANDPKQALAAEIRKARPDWSTRSVIRALERPSVAERPWPLVAEAMRILVADKATNHPGRLEHDGPWWAEAARRLRASHGGQAPPDGIHPFVPHPEQPGRCWTCKTPEDNWHHPRRQTA